MTADDPMEVVGWVKAMHVEVSEDLAAALINVVVADAEWREARSRGRLWWWQRRILGGLTEDQAIELVELAASELEDLLSSWHLDLLAASAATVGKALRGELDGPND